MGWRHLDTCTRGDRWLCTDCGTIVVSRWAPMALHHDVECRVVKRQRQHRERDLDKQVHELKQRCRFLEAELEDAKAERDQYERLLSDALVGDCR